MSYILDALHKSEQQRNGLPEALAEEYRAPEPITEDRRTRWLITAVILFVVFAAIILYFWLSPRQPSMVVKTAAPQTAVVIDYTIAATPPSTLTPPSTPTLAPLHSRDVGDMSQSDVTQQSLQPTEAVLAVIEAENAATTSAVVVAESADTGDINKLYQQRTEDLQALQSPVIKAEAKPAGTAKVDRQTSPKTLYSDRQLQDLIDQARPKAVADIDVRKDRTPLPPYINALTWQQQKTIPALEYGAHIYSSRSGSGFVILNGSKRFAGDQVTSNLLIEAILVDAVQLNFEGLRFRLPAMESWSP
jgi:hypothetical protein